MSTDDQQKRGGLVPIGDVPIGDVAIRLPGIEGRGRAMSSRARHHFTTLRQVNQLIEASEAEPDLGFMARLLALCSLPRTNPRDREKYMRRNGPYVLVLTAGGWPARLPFGNIPRLLLAWVCSEAVRTQRRELVLGRSLYEFMHKLGMEDRSGGRHGERARLKNQMGRLFTCSVQLIYTESDHKVVVSSFVAERAEFWWSAREPNAPSLWDSTIELGEKFFNEIIAHPIPIDLHTLKALKRSPLGLDLYFWLVYRTFTLRQPLTLSWRQIYRQFGAHPADGPADISGFRPAMSPRVEKNQTRVAGPALWDGHGRARDLAVVAAHPAGTTPAHQRIGERAARLTRVGRSASGRVGVFAPGREVAAPGAAQRPVRATWEFSTKGLLIREFSVG